jgi:hypothetical protein
VIGQIADDTTDRRAAVSKNFGPLEYFGPWKPPTFNHGKPRNLKFAENYFRPNLLHNSKRSTRKSLNFCKPYDLHGLRGATGTKGWHLIPGFFGDDRSAISRIAVDARQRLVETKERTLSRSEQDRGD